MSTERDLAANDARQAAQQLQEAAAAMTECARHLGHGAEFNVSKGKEAYERADRALHSATVIMEERVKNAAMSLLDSSFGGERGFDAANSSME